MDVNKYLVIIKNEDKTEDIISYKNNKNLVNIKVRKECILIQEGIFNFIKILLR